MTQPDPGLNPVTPVQALARRVREARTARGWSAQQVADRCARLGMPELDRSTIANIEIGRRKRVGVDEWLVLSLALGVAPVHLLVPLTEEWYAIAPGHLTGSSRVRPWIRGDYGIAGLGLDSSSDDLTSYRAQRPDEEWTPPPVPTPEELERQREERVRQLLEAEEAGVIEIHRREDGVWAITPTERLLRAIPDDEA